MRLRWILPMLALVLVLGGCDEAPRRAEQTPVGTPDLRLRLDSEQIGPSRTDVIITAVNVGTADVLIVIAAEIPANAGADRTRGPTGNPKVIGPAGSEVGGGADVPKVFEWEPERLRAGANLRWEIALRCNDLQPVKVVARMTSTTVGSVVESPFDPMTMEREVTCLPPHRPG